MRIRPTGLVSWSSSRSFAGPLSSNVVTSLVRSASADQRSMEISTVPIPLRRLLLTTATASNSSGAPCVWAISPVAASSSAAVTIGFRIRISSSPFSADSTRAIVCGAPATDRWFHSETMPRTAQFALASAIGRCEGRPYVLTRWPRSPTM